MFDIAWTELLVVAMIALIVVGPKELPGMLRAFGKVFGQVRRTARDFQSTFNDALREAERQAALDDVKKDIESVRNIDPAKDLRKSLDETKRGLSETVTPKTAAKGGADSDAGDEATTTGATGPVAGASLGSAATPPGRSGEGALPSGSNGAQAPDHGKGNDRQTPRAPSGPTTDTKEPQPSRTTEPQEAKATAGADRA